MGEGESILIFSSRDCKELRREGLVECIFLLLGDIAQRSWNSDGLADGQLEEHIRAGGQLYGGSSTLSLSLLSLFLSSLSFSLSLPLCLVCNSDGRPIPPQLLSSRGGVRVHLWCSGSDGCQVAVDRSDRHWGRGALFVLPVLHMNDF